MKIEDYSISIGVSTKQDFYSYLYDILSRKINFEKEILPYVDNRELSKSDLLSLYSIYILHKYEKSELIEQKSNILWTGDELERSNSSDKEESEVWHINKNI